jgi:hypothetical protein
LIFRSSTRPRERSYAGSRTCVRLSSHSGDAEIASFAHKIAVSRDGALEYLERHRIQPIDASLSRMWAVGDASYFGTTLLTGRLIERDLAERLHMKLAPLAGILARSTGSTTMCFLSDC